MKKLIASSLALLLIVLATSCKNDKQTDPVTPYTSVADFLAANKSPMLAYTINGTTGGSFTTLQGTIVNVPANAFVKQNNSPVVGDVKIYFKDIYKKSDMVFNNLSTVEGTFSSRLMKSAGMFCIKVMHGNEAVRISAGHKLSIIQPLFGLPVDTAMIPMFAFSGDSVIAGWFPDTDTLNWTPSNYIYSLYNFNSLGDPGSWSNSDNPTYFSAYSQTPLTLHSLDSFDIFNQEVFLMFTGVNSVVHIYQESATGNFVYPYAPVGLQCTAVAIAVQDGKLYSSFTPVTITENLIVNFSSAETTTEEFKAQLDALNE